MTRDSLATALYNWINERGFEVKSIKSEVIGGSIDYDIKVVSINIFQDALGIILSFAHEAGHLQHYLEDNNLETTCTRKEREQRAFKYGWQILGEFDPRRELVSLEEWQEGGIEEEYI
jgi:hypothetical protein